MVVDEAGARCRAGVVVTVDVLTDSEVRFMVEAESLVGAVAVGGALPPEVEPRCGPGAVGGAVAGGDVTDGVAAPQGVAELGWVTYPAVGAPSGPWASGRFAPTSMRCSVHPSPAWKSTHDTPMSIVVAVGSMSHQRWSADCMKAIVAAAALGTSATHTAVESVCAATAACAPPS